MKKFLTTKINKDQWRLTVPSINNGIFRKSPSKDEDKSDKESKRSSGFYDFQEAQTEYDKTRSLPNSVYIDNSSESDDDEDEEVFEDARAMSDRCKDTSDTDVDVYTDVEPIPQAETRNIDLNNSRYEYDVPRISFKFFDKTQQTENDDKSDENDHQYEDAEHPHYEPVKVVRNELKLSLWPTNQKVTEEEEEFEEISSPVCHPSEKFVSQTEVYVNNLECIPVTTLKSAGSDPNIAMRHNSEEDIGDGFYQVPRSLKAAHRLSQSLKDFDIEQIENSSPAIVSSDIPSIEHISASQILVNEDKDKEHVKDTNKIEKTPSRKLSIPIRTPSFLKKPKKTVEKWNNFKSKFNNIMMEQAAQQRVGAYDDKDRIAINIEEMYKNSKTKCKKMFQNTSKMFQKKKTTVASNDLVEKPHFQASDIEYQLNYDVSDASELTDSKILNPKTSEDDVVVPSNIRDSNSSLKQISIDTSKISSDTKHSCDNKSSEDSKKEDFDFSALKTALKRKIFANEVSVLLL